MNATGLLKDASAKVRMARGLVQSLASLETLRAVNASLQRVIEAERESKIEDLKLKIEHGNDGPK